MSHDPGRCQVDARAAWKTAFGDQPRWQHDVTTAIEGLADLVSWRIRHVVGHWWSTKMRRTELHRAFDCPLSSPTLTGATCS